MAGSPDPRDVRTLYAAMPGDFVAARNELAADLKGAGDAAGAKQVKALRRPTVAAWAVDALAREHAGDLEALIRAGADLAAAQRQVAAGGGLDLLREAAEERRRIIDRLVRAAADALETADMPAPRATLDKVADTLNAIASDQGTAERVLGGVLDKESPPPAGFGDERLDAALLASVTDLPRRTDPATGLTPQQQRKEQERVRRVARLFAEATEVEEEADRLERTAKDAEAAAASAGSAAAAARRRADAARRKAEQAEGMNVAPRRRSP